MPRRRRYSNKSQLVAKFSNNRRISDKVMGVNKVIIVGNLGADPEMRFMPSGNSVTNFRVATSRRFKDKEDNIVEETEWVYVVTYGRVAENCNQYLGRGSLCYVEGRMQTRTWNDNKGLTHYRTEVIAQNVQFLSRGASNLDSPDTGVIDVEGTDSEEIAKDIDKKARAAPKKQASKTNRRVIKKGG